MLAVLQNANSNPTGNCKGLDELKATWLHSFFYLLDNEQSLVITGLGWGMSVDSDYGSQLG